MPPWARTRLFRQQKFPLPDLQFCHLVFLFSISSFIQFISSACVMWRNILEMSVMKYIE